MSFAGPDPVSFNPVATLMRDLRAERAATVAFPPGDTRLNLRRTSAFARDPLPLLLDAYERYGPVFTVRVLHQNVVFALGPAANHYMLVSHAQNFSWREGHLGDLMPLLGDGLLTIDGPFHRRSRQIMLPAFHRERVAASIDLMDGRDRALAARLACRGAPRPLPRGRASWRCASPCARSSAWTPTARAPTSTPPASSSRRWASRPRLLLQVLRGPCTPWARMKRARKRLDGLIFGEIDRRRRDGRARRGHPVLLLDATDEDGSRLSDQHVRDEVMTLLFAGHDTTTSTVGFLFYELARHPEIMARRRSSTWLLDETLRLYPPAWVGPRRSVEPFELAGVRVPGGVPVNYSSWASHHLPDVWDEPSAFRPHRFTAEARARMPKGAYVPFGGGSRTCIGMRFGQLEIKAIAAMILRDWDARAASRLDARDPPDADHRPARRAAGGRRRPTLTATGASREVAREP